MCQPLCVNFYRSVLPRWAAVTTCHQTFGSISHAVSPIPDFTPKLIAASTSTSSCHSGAQNYTWFGKWEHRLVTIYLKGVLGGILNQPNHTILCLASVQHPFRVCLQCSSKATKSLLKCTENTWNSCHDEGTLHFQMRWVRGLGRIHPSKMFTSIWGNAKRTSLCWKPNFHSKTGWKEHFHWPTSLSGMSTYREGGASGCIWLNTSQHPALAAGFPLGPSRAHVCSPQAEPWKWSPSCENTTHPAPGMHALEHSVFSSCHGPVISFLDLLAR